MNNKIYELESLRGIFALLIVFFHFPVNNILYNNEFIKNSFFSVDFFFVLIGFIIGKVYENRINSLNEFKTFLKKRFYRIYPLHFSFLLIFCLIEICKIFFAERFNIYPNNGFANFNDFILNLFLVHGYSGTSYNEPSWSISVEFASYFIFAIFVFFLKKKISYVLIFIMIGLILITYNLFGTSFSQLGRCIYAFFLGYLSLKLTKIITFPNNNILSLFFIIFIFYLISSNLNYKFYFLPIFFSLFIIMVIQGKKGSLLNKLLNLNFLKYLGKISYSLYLTHFALAYILRQILHYVFKFEISNGMLVLNLFYYPIILFYIFLVISVSNYSYQKIEKKYRIQ